MSEKREVRWEYLVPREFEKLVKEEKVCILPIGSLERHGEHMPFGTDAFICHEIAVRAAREEPCVVFPPYWFGQVHEASCFYGTMNFDADFSVKLLQNVLDQIGANGFKKILIVNGHGGNAAMIRYLEFCQLNRCNDYAVYYVFCPDGQRFNKLTIWESTIGGHACEVETSLIMAVAPGSVKLEYQEFEEPIGPAFDPDTMKDVKSALDWYSMYPEHVNGEPSKATTEKGEIAMEAAVEDMIESIRLVKEDTRVPAKLAEFEARLKN